MTTNERGNEIYRDAEADEKLGTERGVDRYHYDFEALRSWRQFDTNQDAWYFGVWVDVANMRTFTYAEGDRSLVICPTLESFRAELKSAEEFYGSPPPAAVAIGADGVITKYFDDRPTADGPRGSSALARALGAE